MISTAEELIADKKIFVQVLMIIWLINGIARASEHSVMYVIGKMGLCSLPLRNSA
jgi:hypothetical protein